MLIRILFATMTVILNPAQAAVDDSPLPGDVPRVRRHFDILYSQEGFMLGQRSNFGAMQPLGIDTSYTGALQLGNGLSYQQLNDSRCASRYQRELDDENATGHPQTDRIEEITRQMNTACLLDFGQWHFNILESVLADRYNKLATQGKSPLVVVYFKRAIGRLAGSIETGQARVWTSDTTNYVLKFWNTNQEVYHPPRFFSKFTGESDLSGTDSFGNWFHRFITQNEAQAVDGYVVRASVDNILLKTYEVVVQTSVKSGPLLQMSVDNRRLFDTIVLGMLSGKPMKVNYIGLRSLFSGLGGLIGYNSDLRVISVESLDTLPN